MYNSNTFWSSFRLKTVQKNIQLCFFFKSYFHILIKFQEDAAGLILRKAAAHGWIFSLLLSYWNYLKRLKLSLSIFLVFNSGKALVSFALVR